MLNKSVGLLLSNDEYFPLIENGQEVPCKEFTCKFGTIDSAIRNETSEARFIFTDSYNGEHSFINRVVVPMKGFADEYLFLACYVDADLVFRVKITSNKMEKRFFWSYNLLKFRYKINGAINDF